jgi:uncharacterized membrane protein (UPF0127 family)
MKFRYVLLPLALCALPTACAQSDPASANSDAAAKTIALTVASSNGTHAFQVEVAKSAGEQEKGLMFRTDIPDNGGMLFWPYPAGGGAPKEASFWMKNTPSPLDIIFIRANGTIARIAENTIPESETHIESGEPVGAVLELRGGRSSELGIAEGDKVTWTGK